MTASQHTADDLQARVFAFLEDPRTHDGAAVTRIDTHSAAVFLAGDRALKVKRAVRFPFLDYSTLALREAACRAEIAINAPFAPTIYRGVVAIVERDGRLAIGGDGEPREWAVEMTRFDERQTLDHLALRHAITRAQAESMAETVFAAHQAAQSEPGAQWLGSIEGLIAANGKALANAFPAARVADLTRRSEARLARLAPLLKARAEAGLIRRCHGDLHLANFVLIDGKPVMFDAIEFDPAIATTDTLYDLAFALMDLVRYGETDAANAALNRYLARAGEDQLDGLAALPLFMSIRAAIRAQVLLARPTHNAAEAARCRDDAAAYFILAERAIAPPSPALLAIGGLSGTGKSYLARALAPTLQPLPGAVVLRSDVLRKETFGVAETERLPAEAYAPQVTAAVYAALAARAARTLRAGHSAVVDAVFARAEERDLIRRVAMEAGCAFQGLFLEAAMPTRLARVGRRHGDASDATAAVVQRQESYAIGALDWMIVDAEGSPEATLAKAQAALARSGLENIGAGRIGEA